MLPGCYIAFAVHNDKGAQTTGSMRAVPREHWSGNKARSTFKWFDRDIVGCVAWQFFIGSAAKQELYHVDLMTYADPCSFTF
jgi:hypothetical protein